jgi:hypothetical protein
VRHAEPQRVGRPQEERRNEMCLKLLDIFRIAEILILLCRAQMSAASDLTNAAGQSPSG